MQHYFAPMEGLTDSVYRRLHHKYFGGVDRYYMPFFSPTVHRALTPREERELPPADTVGFQAVPQLLTKNPEDFLWMAQQCKALGYGEVNLNLGCPSGTVTAKGKGSGMLRDPDTLDTFLYEIFSRTPLPLSIKTRIGFEDPEEFPRLLEIFNRYPIRELIVHPRVRAQFYKGPVNMEVFRYCVANSKAPLCYNGNLTTLAQIQALQREFPQLRSIMLGRGLIADPGMLIPGGTSRESLESFMDELLEEYTLVFGSSRNAMFRLKENWNLLACRFAGGDRLFKQLRKTTDYGEFRALTAQIFQTVPLADSLRADW